MLEQAIVDADALRETALRSAESAILEKYSYEVKEAIGSLLEQDEEMALEPAMEEPMEELVEEPTEEQLVDIPNAHYQKEEIGEDQEVNIDLDKLAEELKKETGEELQEDTEEENLEEGGDEENLEEGGDEEIELTEEQIASIIEKLTIDVKNVPAGQPGGGSNRTLDRENKEIALAQKDTEDVEELEEDEEKKELEESVKKLKKSYKTLSEQNKKYKNMLMQAKEKLEEVNLSNAKLLYTNRVLGSTSLNERQKTKIVEALSNSDSVEEAKVIYETLQSAVGSSRKRNPQSLSEAVKRNSSTTIPRRKEENKSDPFSDRWKTLAGIK
tara:strand:+ start:1915 stop:2898 length:984 start_codon:yes stop_codon:yes gene_type:complete